MVVQEKITINIDESQAQGDEKAGLKDKIKMKQMAFAELKK
jgi:hypothetical protein